MKIDKKLIVEIFQGAVSLAVLGLVIVLYFSTFHGNANENFDSNYVAVNSEKANDSADAEHFNMPTEKTIILRMDDVQGFLWNKIVIKLTDTVLNKNMSITLAVIPNRRVNNDSIIKNYLLSKSKDARIELAQHGTTHSENEFMNLSESETYNLAKVGLESMNAVLNTYPVTFIPPYNEYNKNTTKALSKLGFKILSGRGNEYKFDGNIMYIGYDAQTKYSDQSDLIPVNKIISACTKALEEKNLCVIMIHPQDYVEADNKALNETKYAKFIELLDELKKLNAKSATFKDLLAGRLT